MKCYYKVLFFFYKVLLILFMSFLLQIHVLVYLGFSGWKFFTCEISMQRYIRSLIKRNSDSLSDGSEVGEENERNFHSPPDILSLQNLGKF